MAKSIIINNKLCFIHVPKTAGSFVIRALQQKCNTTTIGSSHDGSETVSRLTTLPMFCFVREPLSWFISWWKYWKSRPTAMIKTKNVYINKPRGEFDKLFSPAMIRFTNIDSFNESLDIYNNEYPGFIYKLFDHYTTKCCYIGKQESMSDNLIEVLTKYNVINSIIAKDLKNISKVKVNTSHNYNINIDKKLKRKFLEIESDTYNKYGYTKEII